MMENDHGREACGEPSRAADFTQGQQPLGLQGVIVAEQENSVVSHCPQADLISRAGQALSAKQKQQVQTIIKACELSEEKQQADEASQSTCTFEVGVSQSTRGVESRAWIRRVLHPDGEIYHWNAHTFTSIQQMLEEAKDVVLGSQLQTLTDLVLHWPGSCVWESESDTVLVYHRGLIVRGVANPIPHFLWGCLDRLGVMGIGAMAMVQHEPLPIHMPIHMPTEDVTLKSPVALWMDGINTLAQCLSINCGILWPKIVHCLAPSIFFNPERSFKLRLDDSLAWAIGKQCEGDIHTYILDVLQHCPILTNLVLVYRRRDPVSLPDVFLEVLALDRSVEGLCQGQCPGECTPREQLVVEVYRFPIFGRSDDSRSEKVLVSKARYGRELLAGPPSLFDRVFCNDRLTVHAPPWFVSLSGGASWIRKEIGLTGSHSEFEKQVREKLRWAKAERANVYIVARGVRIVYNPISCNSILLQTNCGQTELQYKETGDWMDLAGVVMAVAESEGLQQIESAACKPEDAEDLQELRQQEEKEELEELEGREEPEIEDMDGLAIRQPSVPLGDPNGQVAQMLGVPSVEYSTEQHEKASLWFKSTYLVFTGQTWLVRRNPKWKKIWNRVKTVVKSIRVTNISAFGFAIEWSYINVSKTRVGKFFWGKQRWKTKGWRELQSSSDFAELVRWTNEAPAASSQLDWRYVQAIGELLMSKILPIAFYPYGPCCCWRLLYNNEEMEEERNQYERFDYEASTPHPVATNSLLKYVDGDKIYIKRKHVQMSPWALLQQGMELGDTYIQLVEAMDTTWERHIDRLRIASQKVHTMEYIGGRE